LVVVPRGYYGNTNVFINIPCQRIVNVDDKLVVVLRSIALANVELTVRNLWQRNSGQLQFIPVKKQAKFIEKQLLNIKESLKRSSNTRSKKSSSSDTRRRPGEPVGRNRLPHAVSPFQPLNFQQKKRVVE